MERANVRVVQARDGLRLALEPLLQIRVRGDMLREDFDGDGAVEAGIARFVDLTHSARTDGLGDLVVAELGACREGHERSPSILVAGIRRPQTASW